MLNDIKTQTQSPKEALVVLLQTAKENAFKDLQDKGLTIDFQEANFAIQEILYNKVVECFSKCNDLQKGLLLTLSDSSVSTALFNCFQNKVFYRKDNGEVVPITQDCFDKNKELKSVYQSIKIYGLILNIDFFLLNIVGLMSSFLTA